MKTNTPADFALTFRRQAYSGLEYSYDLAQERMGITVAGGPDFMSSVERFTAELPFAEDWSWAVLHFTKFVSPDAFLLRIDCQYDEIIAVTLYCRYPSEPTDEIFESSMALLRPMQWAGPPPSRVASVLGVAGPRGIGLRVDKRGKYKTALYYKVETQTTHIPPSTLPDLALACGLSSDLLKLVAEDMRALYPPGPIGVIGIDSADRGGANALKFNPANVPLASAFAFIKGKGASDARIGELKKIAASLRALWTSYLGCKYHHNGFSGWRLYFSIQPTSISSKSAPRLVMEKSRLPTLRLPHY